MLHERPNVAPRSCLLALPRVLVADGANRLEADDDVSDLGPRDVAVRMLFAPINPSDVNQVRCVGVLLCSPTGYKGDREKDTRRELEKDANLDEDADCFVSCPRVLFAWTPQLWRPCRTFRGRAAITSMEGFMATGRQKGVRKGEYRPVCFPGRLCAYVRCWAT